MKPLDLIQAVDVSLVSKLFASRYHNTLIPLAKRVSVTGDGWMYVLAAILASWSYDIHKLYLLSLLLGFTIERPIYYLLKNILRRNRPFRTLAIKNAVVPSDQFSFPSGHTSAAFMFCLLTINAFPILLWPLVIWALMVGFSRVVLGVHYPTDIMVGAIMGMSLAQFCLYFISV